MTTEPGFPTVPPNPTDAPPQLRNWCSNVAAVIRGLRQGKTDNVGAFTLTASTTTTTVTDPRLGQQSLMVWMPVTANAAAALTGMYVLIANRNRGSFVVTHANTATTDRVFRYAIIG